MAQGPRDWSSAQSRSPGFKVNASRTAMCMAASDDFGHNGRFKEAFEFDAAGRVAEFAEGFGLDLADALAGDLVLVADFLERARETVVQAVAEFQDAALALREAVEDLAKLAAEEIEAGDLAWVLGGLVLNEEIGRASCRERV